MEDSIFRKKNLDRLNSPEQLSDYIKVASPPVWAVLISIIILLVGVVAWGYLGKIGGGKVENCVVISNGTDCVAYIHQKDLSALEGECELITKFYRVGESEASLEMEGGSIVLTDYDSRSDKEKELLTGMGFYPEETVGIIELSGTNLPQGLYLADVIQKGIAPMSLLF